MKVNVISSPLNPLIKDCIKIKNRKIKNRILFIEGQNLIESALTSNLADIKKIFFNVRFITKSERIRIGDLINKNPSFSNNLFQISETVADKLSDTKSTQGVFAIVEYKFTNINKMEFKKNPLIVVCDGVQDVGNLGTIIRIADAMNADLVITLPNTCDPFNQKALRSSAGSIFNIPIVNCDYNEFIKFIKSKNIVIYITDVNAIKNIFSADFKKPIAIIFGNEAHGISKYLSGYDKINKIKIPIFGKIESLNVAISSAICLYEVARQRNLFDVNYSK